LLRVPSLEETHLRVEETAMCLLSAVAHLLPELFARPKGLLGTGEDLFDGVETIGHEIPPHLGFVWLRVVVTLEVKDPIGI